MKVYGVQPLNNDPDKIVLDSPEKRDLITKNMMPYTANSEEKKRGCLAFEPTKAF